MAATAKASRRGARGKKARKVERSSGAAEALLWRMGHEIGGLLLLGTALLSTLALATHSPEDPIWALAPVANRAGAAGATLSGWLLGVVGWGAVVVVGSAGWLGGRLVLGRGLPGPRSRFWPGSVLLLISVATLPLILDGLAPGRLGSPVAGSLGVWLVGYEQLLFSSWGALLVSGLALVLGMLSVAGISTGRALREIAAAGNLVGITVATLAVRGWEATLALVEILRGVLRRSVARLRGVHARISIWREERTERRKAAAEQRAAGREAALAESVGANVDGEYETVIAREQDAAVSGDESGQAQWEWANGSSGSQAAAPSSADEDKDAAVDEPSAMEPKKKGPPNIVDHEEQRRAKPSQESFEFRETGPSGPIRSPDVSIFQSPPPDVRGYDRESLLMNSRILEKKLLDFGVRGRVVHIHPGPVVTMYEYEPAAGIKVNKIVSLTDDLAMALRAISIRIIAPLPGKSVVGIEIPNPDRETVYLRTLLESESFRQTDAPLMVAMGKDIFGNCVSSDLAKMPHLLVAGATGTGKSVFLNSFLCSLIFRTSPDKLKLLLIDPKLLELSVYEGIPHLIAEVVTAPKRAAAALAGIVRKMEERYRMMSAVGVRNVDQFNKKSEEEVENGNETFRLKLLPGETEGQEVAWCQLPYIVVVIDELADLMVLAAKEVEESLQRLAQMARAAGIHLVLATQRPSVDVLTGVIKANFPARISFQVSSGIDSRTILDQKGADNLLGMGDMLFLPPGTSQLQRLHGPFVTEKEVAEIVAFLRDQAKPVYDEDLIKVAQEADRQEARGEDVDEMFDQAVAIVAETRNASISYIQRRLKIGYNRAARIIEYMENEGMVGPQEGTRPRSVFLRQPDEDDE